MATTAAHRIDNKMPSWQIISCCSGAIFLIRFLGRHTKKSRLGFGKILIQCCQLYHFQNVKLRLDFVEIWSFCCHSDFTWNQILASLNGPKMSFLAIIEVLNFVFSKFGQLPSHKFAKIQSSEFLKLQQITFLDRWISRKIWVALKLSNFDKVKPLLHILKVSGA